MSPESTKIAILGAGSWGATLAHVFASCGKNVIMYARQRAQVQSINETHSISKPIAVDIPKSVKATSDLAEAIGDAAIIIFCCTSQSVRALANDLKVHLVAQAGVASSKTPIIVSAVKGLELQTLLRISQVIGQVLPAFEICALSGPNLASEILKGLPAASVISCPNLKTASFVQRLLTVPKFRLYTNEDIIGVELGGSLKNVIAIAAGASDGLSLGSNAKAALLTRGLAEMTRLSVTLGAKPLTLAGLSGMGDLLATCGSSSSRNYRLGFQLAKGKSLADILNEIGAVVEGVTTAEVVCALSKLHNIEMPIARQVEDALKGKALPNDAIIGLMSRPLASET